MIKQENLASKQNISNKKYCRKESDLSALQYKSLTPTYDYLAQLSAEIESLQQRNHSLKNRLSELTKLVFKKPHNKNIKKPIIIFKRHEMKFSEKLERRDKELNQISQSLEKQHLSKNPIFIQSHTKSNKTINSDLIKKPLLISNPQSTFFTNNDIYRENEDIRALISNQEEELRLLNAKLHLFHRKSSQTNGILTRKLLASKKFIISETIPTERSELETEKKVLQQELQILIKKRKEIQFSQSKSSLLQRQNEKNKPSILSPMRRMIVKLKQQRHPTLLKKENHPKQNDKLTCPRNKNPKNIQEKEQLGKEKKAIANNFKSKSINQKEDSINQENMSLEDSRHDSDDCDYIDKNKILKELAKTKERQKKLIDNFILMNKIGEGSYGKVYKVRQRSTNEILAAKISIDKLDEIPDDKLLDVTREVNIIVKLNFPSILKFVFFSPIDFKGRQKPVIITEYAQNESLGKLIELERSDPAKKILNSTQKLIIIYGIASAMSYLHSYNIIHRDLKPDNILLDEYLFPKVADFGLSKINHKNEQSITMKSNVCLKGTPKYISPEIFRNAEYTKKGDVYAFGIIVYELMTNLKPFEDLTFMLLSIKVMNGYRPDIGVQIPESYVKLIQDCWSQEASKRPTFNEILERLLNDRGFITELVNESEFIKYVNYVKEYKSSFDQTKNIFYRDLHNNFTIIDIKEKGEDKITKIINNSSLFPYKEYIKLDEITKKLVDEAKEDPSKQFCIGISLIEGRMNFPRNIQIGLKYLKKSIEKDFLEAIIYYCEMFIKGRIIPQDLDKARKIADKKLRNHESEYSMILGKIEKKENKYEESIKYFLKSIEGGNAESMYEYGKMLYKGEWHSKCKGKGLEYFKRAIDKGHAKSMLKYGKILKKDFLNIEKGNKYIKNSADLGYNKASYCYSIILEKGDGIEINKKESKRYLREGARRGHIESMFKYGIELLNDPKSRDKSVFYLKKLNEEGHIKSMYHYGMMLWKGKGVEKNTKEAVKYLRMSAYGGNPDAMAIYGDMLLHGNDVPVDKDEALKLFQRGIELGNGEAMYNYGYMLESGDGVPINIEEAIKYYKMAIDKGNSSAMNNYASMLRLGNGVPVNKEEAVKYYKMAIEQGSVHAIKNYADMLRYGEGVPLNKEEANKYYKLSIERGCNDFITEYIQMLKYEEGVEADREKAINILKKAIEKGDSNAMNQYALMLYKGENIPINEEEAIKYFKMSIDRGNIDAMINYAILLADYGKSPLYKEESTKYFKLAIEKGSTLAMIKYADVLFSGEENESNKEEAIKYYKMAIEKGDTDAMNSYAVFLYNGEHGIAVDKKEALKYLKMAVDRGNTTSILNYVQILQGENDNKSNKQEIIKYLKIAIDRGDDNAMNKYASILHKGEIVDGNKEDCVKYLKMAINRGNTTAMMCYGLLLYNGDIIDMNKLEGIKYVKMAADRNNEEAIDMLGEIPDEELEKYYKTAIDKGSVDAMREYASHLYLTKDNYEEGSRYFKMAIDNGDVNAMRLYAHCLLIVDDTNIEESIKYFKMAADKGCVDAMFVIGNLLFEGKLIEANKAEAFKYFKRASEQCDVRSMEKCGDMLFTGDGVPVDKAEALKYYKNAADKGNESSMNKYAEIIFKGDGITANKEEGLKYFHKAIGKNNVDAMGNYGEILLRGEGVPHKEEEGIKYIKLSSEDGSNKGMYLYGCLLEEGKYVEHDKEKSIQYFIKSSNEGNLEAIRHYNQILDIEEKNYKYEEDSPRQKRIIKRRRSFCFFAREKLSLLVKLDEVCKLSFIDCEFGDSSSLFYVAVSLIEGKNNYPMNKAIGKEYLERSIKKKNVAAIKYYSKYICEKKSHFILNEISSIHDSSNIKVYLSKDILSRETFDIEISTKKESINYELAKEMSKESSDMGNLRGMFIYGQLCMKNKKNQTSEIRSNFKESFSYIERAAKSGDSAAMSLYGYFLEFGIGCTHKNVAKAVEYYKKSCDKRNLSGCARYGYSLIEGLGGLEKDVTEGLRLIKHSFDHNDPIGIHVYACYLYRGLPNLGKDLKLANFN